MPTEFGSTDFDPVAVNEDCLCYDCGPCEPPVEDATCEFPRIVHYRHAPDGLLGDDLGGEAGDGGLVPARAIMQSKDTATRQEWTKTSTGLIGFEQRDGVDESTEVPPSALNFVYRHETEGPRCPAYHRTIFEPPDDELSPPLGDNSVGWPQIIYPISCEPFQQYNLLYHPTSYVPDTVPPQPATYGPAQWVAVGSKRQKPMGRYVHGVGPTPYRFRMTHLSGFDWFRLPPEGIVLKYGHPNTYNGQLSWGVSYEDNPHLYWITGTYGVVCPKDGGGTRSIVDTTRYTGAETDPIRFDFLTAFMNVPPGGAPNGVNSSSYNYMPDDSVQTVCDLKESPYMVSEFRSMFLTHSTDTTPSSPTNGVTGWRLSSPWRAVDGFSTVSLSEYTQSAPTPPTWNDFGPISFVVGPVWHGLPSYTEPYGGFYYSGTTYLFTEVDGVNE